MFCPKCGRFAEDGHDICKFCGYAANEDIQSHSESYQITVSPSMKWFKFVIYFQLFLSVVAAVIVGVVRILGLDYENDGQGFRQYIYDDFPALRPYHLVFGVLFILEAVYALYTRWCLARFMKKGPNLYLGYLGAITAINFIGSVTEMIILDDYNQFVASVLSVIIGIIAIALNSTYFSKRKYLFVN